MSFILEKWAKEEALCGFTVAQARTARPEKTTKERPYRTKRKKDERNTPLGP